MVDWVAFWLKRALTNLAASRFEEQTHLIGGQLDFADHGG